MEKYRSIQYKEKYLVMMDPKKNKQKINKNNLNLKTKLKVVLLAYTFLGVNNYSKINLGYFHVFFYAHIYLTKIIK